MITPELVQQVESLKLPETIHSVSLFSSDKYDIKKHFYPFIRYLDQSGAKEKTLVFRTAEFAQIDEYLHHVVEVPQLPHYQNHLYRYLGVAAKVRNVVCVGSDEPELHPDLNRCVSVSNLFNYDFVCALMENHPKVLIGGRCVFTQVERQKLNVLSFLQEFFHNSGPCAADWNIDQYFLTDYIKYYTPPTVINCPAGVFKQRTFDFLNNRLDSLPTIIVREPNRYDKFR